MSPTQDPPVFALSLNPMGGFCAMPQRDDLEVLRAGLLEAFGGANDAVKAQIAGQLRAVIKDLASLGGEQEASVADEIAARRETRRTGTADRPPAARRSQPRRRAGGNRAS